MKEQVLAVERMQEYIKEHLFEEITPAALSAAAMFSPWHSHRLFKEYTGVTPADYIRRLRLSESALCLKAQGEKVADIAFRMGFASVDGYQRAFHREFGCNPKEYSVNPVPIPLFIGYGVKFKEIMKEKREEMSNSNTVFVQTVEKPARKVIVKRGIKASDYMAYCEEVGCDVWGVLMSMDSLCGEPVCLWLPEKYRKSGTSEYVQGVEVSVDSEALPPEGFDIIDLPAATYLCFHGEPFKEEDFCEAIRAVQNAADKYEPSFIGYEWDSESPKIQLEPRGNRGYIELRAVKKK